MAHGTARIEIRPVGEDRVRRALNGTTREARRAQRTQRRDRRQTERDVERGERDKTRAVKRGTRQQTRTVRDAEREARREDQRTTREFEKNQRARTRAAKRGARQRRRSTSQGFGKGLGATKAALGGLGIAAGGTALLSGVSEMNAKSQRAMQRTAGVQGVFEALPENLNMTEEVVKVVGQTTSDKGEMEGKTDEIIREMNAAASETGVDQEQLFAGLKSFQLVFSDLEFGRKVMKDIARTAEATGTPFEDLVRLLGEARQQFGITADEADEFLNLTVQQGKQGAIQPGEFANAFSREFGTFTAARGTEGLGASREFGAIAQVMRKGGGEPEIVATRMRALLLSLSDKNVQKRFQEKGIDVTNEKGQVRNIADIFGEVADSDINTLQEFSEVIPERRGALGAVTLANQVRAFRQKEGEGQSENVIRDLANVSAEKGGAGIDAVMQVLEETPSVRLRRRGLKTKGRQIEGAQDVAEAEEGEFRDRQALKDAIPGLDALKDMPIIGGQLTQDIAMGHIGQKTQWAQMIGGKGAAKGMLEMYQSVMSVLPGAESGVDVEEAFPELSAKVEQDGLDGMKESVRDGAREGVREALEGGSDPRSEEGGWFSRLF